MLDKEPTLLDIEKIFSMAMIEEGEDWKTINIQNRGGRFNTRKNSTSANKRTV